eukprot:gnl/MRDRNA2_/MRDRNA2_100206_c0_seq1.p1 gnl/MRDRNA2_/MRDRNA2_100206_c0~~gnl/MRDRNA2_/MRDRNA2_100206_c0_seq1.p1  ORF type:complete len:641 (-),score=63.93 gnl/MRDRNA2_/MRDRNA2_100206_c0_seq1:57-1979(-)
MSYISIRPPYNRYRQEPASCTCLRLAVLSLVTLDVGANHYETSSCADSMTAEGVSEGSCLLQQMRSAGPIHHVDTPLMQTQHAIVVKAPSTFSDTPPPDVSPVWKVADLDSLPYVPHHKERNFEPFATGKEGQTPQGIQEQIADAPLTYGTLPRMTSPDGNVNEHHQQLEHYSVFMVPWKKLDRAAFWLILVCMILFIMLIDQCESILTKWCKHEKTDRMFINRVKGKLTIFGIVGLGAFIATNFVSYIPEEYFQLFEFIDILCSLGAVGVIVMAVILWMLRRIMERRWAVLEYRQDDIPRNGDGRIRMDQSTMRQFEWSLMSRKFRLHQQLPSAFSYLKYLRECLAQNVCELMNLNWWSWLLLLLFSLIGLGACWLHQGACSLRNNVWDKHYVIGFLVLVWGTFVLFVFVHFEVNSARAHLREELGIQDQTQERLEKSLSTLESVFSMSDSSRIGVPDHPKSSAWAGRIKQVLQFLSLGTAFEAAFYLLNVKFNLTRQRYSWLWHFAMVIPLFLNFFCMLPMIISRFTMVEAYFSPDYDAIDNVVHSMRLHHEDLRFMHHLWSYKGKPVLDVHSDTVSGKDVNKKEFNSILQYNGIQISRERSARIFNYFDSNNWGLIDLQRVNHTLSSMRNSNGSGNA